MACYRLRNPVQRYAWGSPRVLPDLLGEANPSQEPWAELWVGAHPRASSSIEVGGVWHSLRRFVENSPARVLGGRVAARFGAQLPFLLKVLAVERPLSLQTHPDAQAAALGWAREEAAGVAVDAPERSYPDANPKPELVCALGEFEAVCRFRPLAALRERAAALAARGLEAELAASRAATPGDAFAYLLTRDPERRRALAEELAACAAADETGDAALAWVARLHEAYPGDVAVAAPLLLHHVRLRAGEALDLAPGDLHAYLRGTAVEVMASSDNVLRAGLTRKPIAVDELLAVLQREASDPPRVKAVPGAPGESVYETAGEWFRLSLLRPERGAPLPVRVSRGAELLLCVDGDGELVAADGAAPVAFRRGEALFVAGETPRYELRAGATLARATAGLASYAAPSQEAP
jgi:mannose-6-phosphate isomerase